MKWTKVTIETTTQATDMLSYVLGEYGVEGIEVEDNIPLSDADKKAMFIDILPELPPDDGVAHVSCYLDEKMDVRDLCGFIGEQMDELSAYMDVGSGSISIGETEDKDWQDNWKEFFHPFRIEGNILIQPTWTEKEDIRENDIVIHIDPGTAFGTGSHETTRLCAAGLKKYMGPGGTARVLDVGCGSGILSVIALKLGADFVYGIDIDELAVQASRENLELNGLSREKYCIAKGDVMGDGGFASEVAAIGQYDIVVANILAEVIIPLSAVIRPFMKDGGVFISSGIIDTKETVVEKALTDHGFTVIDTVHMGEWVSFVAQ